MPHSLRVAFLGGLANFWVVLKAKFDNLSADFLAQLKREVEDG